MSGWLDLRSSACESIWRETAERLECRQISISKVRSKHITVQRTTDLNLQELYITGIVQYHSKSSYHLYTTPPLAGSDAGQGR